MVSAKLWFIGYIVLDPVLPTYLHGKTKKAKPGKSWHCFLRLLIPPKKLYYTFVHYFVAVMANYNYISSSALMVHPLVTTEHVCALMRVHYQE